MKFCGICRPEDAAEAVRAGADFVGVVLHRSAARAVSLARAADVLARLPPSVVPVGLFVDAGADEVRSAAGRLRLTHVQLHGDEPVAAVRELSAEFRVIKAVRVEASNPVAVAAALDPWRAVGLAGLLLETAGGPGVGGTGVANDWAGLDRARRAGAFDGLPPLIAAGGLTAATVGDAIRAVRPATVDVSSGIEDVRRVKSAAKMAAFAAAVAAADRTR